MNRVHKRLMILATFLLLTGVHGISYGLDCEAGVTLSTGESCTYPGTRGTFSVLNDGKARWNIPGLPWWLGWINHASVDGPIKVSVNFNGVQYDFAANKQADGTWLIGTVGDDSVTPPPPLQKPDLVVGQPIVGNDTLTPGESFMLSVTVENQGTGDAAATTLRYYRSTNATITTRDTEVGTDRVNALGSNGTANESIRLTAPTSPGTYYYGACVDSLDDEDVTDNNCSTAVSIHCS